MMAGENEGLPALEPSAEKPFAYRWYHKLAAVLFATFCLEVGFFLLIFPWTDGAAYFANFVWPQWRAYCESQTVRAAVSALGAVNLGIAVVEIYRLRRFTKPNLGALSSPAGSVSPVVGEQKSPAE